MNTTARSIAFVTCVSAFCIAGAARAAETGHFEKLPDGCEVWVPKEGATVQQWTGTCRDGKAEGTGVLTGTQPFDGKSHAWRYEGRMHAGKRTGFAHNSVGGIADFLGQYRNGIPNGWGRNRWGQGESFEGRFRNGIGNGIATKINANGMRTRARYVDDKLVGVRQVSTSNGGYAVFDPAEDGTVRGISQGGGEYEVGQFRLIDDSFQQDGAAMFFWREQHKVYVGHFEHDLPNGFGVYVAPDKKNPADAAAWPGNWQNGCNWRDIWITNVVVAPEKCRR